MNLFINKFLLGVQHILWFFSIFIKTAICAFVGMAGLLEFLVAINAPFSTSTRVLCLVSTILFTIGGSVIARETTQPVCWCKAIGSEQFNDLEYSNDNTKTV